MPLRSVLDIEVNDSSFRDHVVSFDKYRESTKAEREAWHKEEADRKRAERAEIAGERDEQRKSRERMRDLEKQGPIYDKLGRAWKSMREESSTVARNVREIGSRLWHMTTSAMKITGALGLLGGLATGFGFLGMDSIARTAAGYRRSAIGLGTTMGGKNAAELDFGRFVDPNAVLSGVNRSLRDPSQNVLRGLGIMPQGGEDSADVMASTLMKVQELAKAQPEATLGNLFKSRQLDQLGLTLEDLMRLRRMTPEELRTQVGAFRRDRRGLNVSDADLRNWVEFQTQLSRAGKTIEATFIRRLTALTPSLTKLSAAVVKVMDAFLSKPELQHWIDEAAVAVEHFADYIGSKKFQDDVGKFVEYVERMWQAMKRFTDLFLNLFGPSTPTPADDPTNKPDPAHAPAVSGYGFDPNGRWRFHNKDGSWSDEPGHQAGNLTPADRPTDIPRDTWHLFSSPKKSEAEKEAYDFFKSKGDYSENEIDGILSYINNESGFDPKSHTDEGGGQGASGIGQWRGERLDRFRAMFGHDVREGTVGEQLAFLDWEYRHTHKPARQLLSEHAGSAADAAVAVTHGFGGVRDDQIPAKSWDKRKSDADWYHDHPPTVAGQRTSFYDRARAAHVHVTIRNETGGNAIIAASQLA